MNTDRIGEETSEITPERRRNLRYRYSAPITVFAADGSAVPGMTLEISASGLSVVIGVPLQVGDTAEVEPVGGGKALVRIRRNLGRVYGFEFIDLTTEQTQHIRNQCKMLPAYRCPVLSF